MDEFQHKIQHMIPNSISLTLTLVVPVMHEVSSSDAPQGDAASPRMLELLLTRAQHAPADANIHGLLYRLFDVALPPENDVPIAPVTYLLDQGEPPQGYCLRADPVHVVADRDVLRVMEPHALSVLAAEARELIATLNAHFAQDGLQFVAPQPGRWYLVLPDDPLMRTHPLPDIAGASLQDHLPFGQHGKRWHAVLNEIQMLLHEHPANDAREMRGEPPVNSVWFWGGGYLPRAAKKKWAQVWSGDAVALGLARLSEVPYNNAPDDARGWLDAAAAGGDHLLVLPPVTHTGLAEMDTRWFAPLYDALKKRRMQRLTLHLLNGAAYRVDAAALKRWWLRRRPLARFFDTSYKDSN